MNTTAKIVNGVWKWKRCLAQTQGNLLCTWLQRSSISLYFFLGAGKVHHSFWLDCVAWWVDMTSISVVKLNAYQNCLVKTEGVFPVRWLTFFFKVWQLKPFGGKLLVVCQSFVTSVYCSLSYMFCWRSPFLMKQI